MPKKTNAIKVTDRNKPWNRKAEPTAYKIESRKVNKTILIVTEGQTESLYFKSFPVLTLTIEAVDLKGQSKLKLIKATETITKDSDIEFDEIWCVFDIDVKQGAKEFADFDNAIESGTTKGYKIAYSNDCFEVWYYLHYNYTDEEHHRTFYYQELSDRWNCNYVKAGKKYSFCSGTYKRLREDVNASQAEAILRAKKLYENQSSLVFHEQNPVTRVYELVEFLNKNLRP